MAQAAFLYLTGEDQEDGLVKTLADSREWLVGEAATVGAQTGPWQGMRAILESQLAVEFCWLTEAEAARGWPCGRAFGALGELTWRREDGLTHIVLVTDRDGLPAPFRAGAAIPLHRLADGGRSDKARLWGERQGDDVWRETRIPGPLTYPIAGTGRGRRATLQVRRYVEDGKRDAGLVEFVRYVDVLTE